MFKKIMIIGCLSSASFFMACNQVETAPVEKKEEINSVEKWKPEDRTESELVLVMREMYDQNMLMKEKIINGEEVNSYPDFYKNIHTAEATEPSDKDETYHSFADLYLSNMDALAMASPDDKLMAFNQTVNTCVSCHQQYCQGPIPKIKKLLIQE